MNVEPMLVISTGHLPKYIFDTLTKESALLTRTIPHAYGVIIYADEPREENPPELRAVITEAQRQGCSWINFDRDADSIHDLPLWKW